MGIFRFGSTHAEVQPGKSLGDEGCVHEHDRPLRVFNVLQPDHFLGTVRSLLASPINPLRRSGGLLQEDLLSNRDNAWCIWLKF